MIDYSYEFKSNRLPSKITQDRCSCQSAGSRLYFDMLSQSSIHRHFRVDFHPDPYPGQLAQDAPIDGISDADIQLLLSLLYVAGFRKSPDWKRTPEA